MLIYLNDHFGRCNWKFCGMLLGYSERCFSNILPIPFFYELGFGSSG